MFGKKFTSGNVSSGSPRSGYIWKQPPKGTLCALAPQKKKKNTHPFLLAPLLVRCVIPAGISVSGSSLHLVSHGWKKRFFILDNKQHTFTYWASEKDSVRVIMIIMIIVIVIFGLFFSFLRKRKNLWVLLILRI